jgi:molybdopterin-guanine dinucleotide biosynthesis protein A
MNVLCDITGLILAGGRGRRVQGADKGLLPYQGRPMIASVIERLAPQVHALIISANRNVAIYRQFGWPVVTDELREYQGPLAGLCCGLAATASPWLLSVPCDGPRLPLDLAARLAAVQHDSGARVVIASDGSRTQFAYALIATGLLPDLRAWLAEGHRRLGGWLERQHPAIVDCSDVAQSFANFNQTVQIVR